MGYPEGVKWYKVWCGAAHKCVVSRDIVFHEEAIIKPDIVTYGTNLSNEDQIEATEKTFRIEVNTLSDNEVEEPTEDVVDSQITTDADEIRT